MVVKSFVVRVSCLLPDSFTTVSICFKICSRPPVLFSVAYSVAVCICLFYVLLGTC